MTTSFQVSTIRLVGVTQFGMISGKQHIRKGSLQVFSTQTVLACVLFCQTNFNDVGHKQSTSRIHALFLFLDVVKAVEDESPRCGFECQHRSRFHHHPVLIVHRCGIHVLFLSLFLTGSKLLRSDQVEFSRSQDFTADGKFLQAQEPWVVEDRLPNGSVDSLAVFHAQIYNSPLLDE
ncbi:uncharacterized protein HMPREF1120_03307 [Exophiala dermatitidis NIH/UT8656]|uniref:Uncharacterized protein n=1 Tax=Exophiala dermatitidis (strain ATCC 34100 / CBS 525.76 / NIH/UT8656) TaxID=858893 RepID=H6BW57_EXODN|nr:uncharacterized protein HMPREF1120_03307 [Exophiala dermatitidis NIH/UT8656]EHY55157.1 hypothetical protein HMPREF1120_03307 [Exophiala dermatitidis NIH/UT8656]